MLLGIALLAAMDASAKWMVLDNIHPLQLLAVRSVVIVIVLIVGYSIRNNLSELRPTRPWIQALRGTSGIIAPLSFFLSLKYLPLTDAVVVFFTSVFAITIISAYFLGERVGWHRWSAVILGYFGVAIAMAPTGSGAIAGYALVLVSSISYAGLFTSGRWLSETESVSSLVFSYNAGVGLIACCLLPFLWTSMNATEWVLLMLLSGFAVAGHFAITYAFSLAEASAIAPFEYTAIIWALLFDYYIWGSIPPLTTCAGAALIISSGLYVLHRENKNRQAGR
ncbi:hypothetical protein AB833_23565 [Chromatiales bacterium (ex Bugula neritina AB1)]|nr:hypothetical protein AB833_23565 [Chromatiales bacterium (ex Bugula neritina AB1)]